MNISNSHKYYIYNRDKKRCFYCKKKLKYRQITLDHFYPKSKGGTEDVFNLVLACNKCNRLKGNKVVKNYEEIIIFMFKKAYIDNMLEKGNCGLSNKELKKEVLNINKIEAIKPSFVFQSNNIRFYISNNKIDKIIFLGG